MVVSDDPVASEWGAEILRRGGNAVDAAVATAFTLAVTRPHYAALGGGGFIVYCPAPSLDKIPDCKTLDFREKAPQAAYRDLFVRNGKADSNLSRNGALASGVPGIPAGLLKSLEFWGSQKRQKILEFPIRLATEGFQFTPHEEVAAAQRWAAMNPETQKLFGCSQDHLPLQLPDLNRTFSKLSRTQRNQKSQLSSRRVASAHHQSFAPSNTLAPCPPGTLIQQKDLARVLTEISHRGQAGFYEGWVGKRLVKGLTQAGGILTEADLKLYEPKSREPILSEFQGLQVVSMPPPSSGGIVLSQLLEYAELAQSSNLLKNGYGAPETIHALAHAMALGFRDRAHFLGDPDSVSLPNFLLSPDYLKRQWHTFNPDHARLAQEEPSLEEKHPQTTHLSALDSKGNLVAMTLTINDNFGSGFTPPGTGVVMNNQMDDFSIQTGVPNLYGLVGKEANAIGSEKRPLSSMTPTIIREKSGRAKIAIGAAGGPRIITSVYLSLVNRLLFKMSLRDAVASPRFHQQWVPKPLFYERNTIPHPVIETLNHFGYQTEEQWTLGKVHAVELLPNGRSSGAADPRGEGAAVAE
jgi:gamma-glutamyltranspeptidase/glutathione hydrolase